MFDWLRGEHRNVWGNSKNITPPSVSPDVVSEPFPLTHLFNTLARFSQHLKGLYAKYGVRGAIAFIRESCAAPWLDPERIKALLSRPVQLKFE